MFEILNKSIERSKSLVVSNFLGNDTNPTLWGKNTVQLNFERLGAHPEYKRPFIHKRKVALLGHHFQGWYQLTKIEQVLLYEIVRDCIDNGDCQFTNQSLSFFVPISTDLVQKILNRFMRLGLIQVNFEYGYRRINIVGGNVYKLS